MICINTTDDLNRLTQCLCHTMWKQVNILWIKVPPLINHLVLITEQSIINLMKRGIKPQATPIVFNDPPHVVVYLIYRFQMVDQWRTQVLQQTTYLSHNINSSKFNRPNHHTNVLLALMENFSSISAEVSISGWKLDGYGCLP